MKWLTDALNVAKKASTQATAKAPASQQPASRARGATPAKAAPAKAAPKERGAAPAPRSTGLRAASGWNPNNAIASAQRAEQEARAKTTKAAGEMFKVDPTERDPGFGRQATVANVRFRPTSGIDPAAAMQMKATNEGTPRAKLEKQRAEAVAEEKAQPREWKDVRAKELTDDEYLALSPRQRAAVQFNTGLLAASASDKSTGGDAATRNYLSGLDLLEDGTDVDAYLKLDRAVGMSIISKLDDKGTRQSSAESLRWAQGIPGAAPRAASFSAAMDSAGLAADAMALRMSNGMTGLGPGAAQAPGFGDSTREGVLRQAYDFMVDSQYDMTSQDIADGLLQLNAANTTDVTTQELWDFTKRQLDAVDFGAVRGRGTGTVAHSNPEITPLSVADIRARYGL